MKEIEFQLTAQDVRYPVYEYMELDGGNNINGIILNRIIFTNSKLS